MTTHRLISKRLPTQVDEPWIWQELKRRLTAGDLTNEEVDDAIRELTAHMQRTKPAGWNETRSWQQNFLKLAIQKGMISEPVFLALCDAFFGPTPTVQMTTPALNEDDTRFDIRLEYGTPWSDNSGLDVKLLWDIEQVLATGWQAREFKQRSRSISADRPP